MLERPAPTSMAAPVGPVAEKRSCGCGTRPGEGCRCGAVPARAAAAGFRFADVPVIGSPGRAKAAPSDKGPEPEVEPAPVVSPLDETEEAPEEEAGPAEETRAVDDAAPAPSVEFAVTHATGPPPTDDEGMAKAKCPAPRAAPTTFRLGRSTPARIAAMGACTWGITSPDPLVVTTRTCKDGGAWHLRVRRVRSLIRTFSRQLPGQREPTTANATAANFCNQVGDLDALGNCGGGFYMLRAVRAHEAVHVTEWKTSFPTDWPAQKAAIEAISVPAAGATARRGAATRAMRASAAFRNAILTNRASGNYPAFWGIPDPNVNTDAAERVVVAPRIRQICGHARARGWGPAACAVCAANGIT